jgi:hypothetical protein
MAGRAAEGGCLAAVLGLRLLSAGADSAATLRVLWGWRAALADVAPPTRTCPPDYVPRALRPVPNTRRKPASVRGLDSLPMIGWSRRADPQTVFTTEGECIELPAEWGDATCPRSVRPSVALRGIAPARPPGSNRRCGPRRTPLLRPNTCPIP